jgi:Na+/H+ antiporter NhaD/arsenite permease-like protein
MHPLALIIFLVTYTGIALGGIPGLALDRTGIAVLGAIAFIATGIVSTGDAVKAIDFPTILLLYSLMVLSSQFRLGGFYTWAALRITRLMNRPQRFLLALMIVSALLSAVLANDIVCLAFTPVLAVSLLRAGLNPVPFLIGLAVASNIGSAATIIGNPQNMLIGQVGRLDFGRFFLWCAPPSFLSLAAGYLIIIALYKQRFTQPAPPLPDTYGQWPAFDRHQSNKGILATMVLIALFFTSIPREISAIAIAGLLLCSRKMQTRSLLGLVDWHLITLFCALFIVIKGIETTQLSSWIIATLQAHRIDLQQPFMLTILATLLSNLVSNVPATMLLTKFLDPSQEVPWYVLALASTYAGNLITIGSIANLITFEQAKEYGIAVSFREHAKAGIPVTAASLLIALLWIAAAEHLFGS